jgi:hypothetical protein
MSERAQELPIVVGSWSDEQGRRHFLGFSEVESRRAMMAWHRILAKSSVRSGQTALVVSTPDDVHQAMPLEMALDDIGVIILNADASPFEAQRIEAFIRNFDPEYVFGLTASVLQGLRTAGHDPAALLRGRSAWLRDCACRELAGVAGLRVMRWTALGPATLIGCGRSDALHIDAMEWQLELRGDAPLLTHRFTAADSAPLHLQLSHSVRLLGPVCACGSTDPLVEIAP